FRSAFENLIHKAVRLLVLVPVGFPFKYMCDILQFLLLQFCQNHLMHGCGIFTPVTFPGRQYEDERPVLQSYEVVEHRLQLMEFAIGRASSRERVWITEG